MICLVAANDLPEYHLTIYDGARGDPCLHAVRRTLLAPDHQAHDRELLQELDKLRASKHWRRRVCCRLSAADRSFDHGSQAAVQPPSIINAEPVTSADASDAR